MRKELVLYVCDINNPQKNAVAATLAWLAGERGAIFDVYYDAYRLGAHFGGGDPDDLPFGQLTGGLVAGGRHVEAFYLLAHKFDLHIIAQGESIICSAASSIGVPLIAQADDLLELYEQIFEYFRLPTGCQIVMIDSEPTPGLRGVDAYFFPEVYYRHAIGVEASIACEHLERLARHLRVRTKILAAGVSASRTRELSELGFDLHLVETILETDDYCSVTSRLAKRWLSRANGWILGDPILVSCWLPRACEESLLPIYSKPQSKVIDSLSNELQSKGRVVLGRQFEDRDFFDLSRFGQCLQVIDPGRPPFTSQRHVDYRWDRVAGGFFDHEPSDAELSWLADNNKVLISLVFWSGAIRELENIYNIVDLVALTRLRAGLVVTAQSFDYMRHFPMALLNVPIERGGVYPHLEPLLGSAGIGIAIEALLSPQRLQENLCSAMNCIRDLVGRADLLPRGVWFTLDAPLEQAPWYHKLSPIELRRERPFARIRYEPNGRRAEPVMSKGTSEDCAPAAATQSINDRTVPIKYEPNAKRPIWRRLRRYIGQHIRRSSLAPIFEERRPYEFYRPGALSLEVVSAAKAAGLEYMLTKSGFGKPAVQYLDDQFVAINYTAGRWDGWTPFYTVNDISDLKVAERKALHSNAPGWILSTIDSCLWTFSGSLWERGTRLLEIAKFVANGGDSSQLINVTPHTIARYARIVEEKRRLAGD